MTVTIARRELVRTRERIVRPGPSIRHTNPIASPDNEFALEVFGRRHKRHPTVSIPPKGSAAQLAEWMIYHKHRGTSWNDLWCAALEAHADSCDTYWVVNLPQASLNVPAGDQLFLVHPQGSGFEDLFADAPSVVLERYAAYMSMYGHLKDRQLVYMQPIAVPGAEPARFAGLGDFEDILEQQRQAVFWQYVRQYAYKRPRVWPGRLFEMGRNAVGWVLTIPGRWQLAAARKTQARLEFRRRLLAHEAAQQARGGPRAGCTGATILPLVSEVQVEDLVGKTSALRRMLDGRDDPRRWDGDLAIEFTVVIRGTPYLVRIDPVLGEIRKSNPRVIRCLIHWDFEDGKRMFRF